MAAPVLTDAMGMASIIQRRQEGAEGGEQGRRENNGGELSPLAPSVPRGQGEKCQTPLGILKQTHTMASHKARGLNSDEEPRHCAEDSI